MAKTKAQIEFEAVTSGFNSGIKSMDQSLTTLRKELNLNSAELKENGDSVDLLSKRKDILQQQAEASAKKVELLGNKLNEAKRLFGESSKEVYQLNNKLIDSQSAYQRVQNEITQTTNKIEEFSSDSYKAKKVMGELGDSVDELSDGFTTMKGAIADLVADGVQELSGALKDLAVDSDTAHSSFQAQTGASKDEMVEFESAMEEIYSNNFGESLNDIANAMAEVKQQTKETDPSKLKDLTQNALVLRDTFDMDVKESMRAVNSLMNQFGIDGDEAFNLIVQGAQNGLNANDDLLDTINEYSVQFKNAGYSADDMLNMLYNGAETGTWSIDKLGDAVKEMNIRFSDGTVADALDENKKALGLTSKEVKNLTSEFNKGGDSSKEAIGKVIESIMSVEDETERYKLGVQVFGTMWEDLGAETISSLMSTKGEINSTKGAMEELTQVKYDNITSELGEISRGLKEDILIPVIQDLLPVLKDGLNWLKDNLNWLLPTITGIGIAIGTYFVVSKFISFIGVLKTLFTLVKSGTGIMTALNTVMALNPIALIVGAIVGLIAVFVLLWNKCDGFREFWINLWEKIKSIVSGAIDFIVEWFNKIVDFVKNNWQGLLLMIVNPFAGAFKLLYDNCEGFRNFIDNLIENIKSILSTIGEWINSNVIQPILNFFKSLWNGIQAVWDGIVLGIKIFIGLVASLFDAGFQIITLPFRFIWENCKEYVFQAWEFIKEKVSTAINVVKNVITNVFNSVKSFFSTVWNGIKSIFTNVWNGIVNFITPIVNKIKTTITNVFNKIKSTIQNILNGIKSVATSIWNAIKNAISNVVNGIKSVITSVFNGIKTFASNVWNGIKTVIINPIKNAWNTVKSTTNNIKNGVVNTFNSLKSKVTSIFNKVKDGITKPINTAKDKVKGIVDKIKGLFNFQFKLPKIKTPKFGISPKGWKVGDLLKGSIPKLSIKWNAEGGIFKKPTIFDTQHGFQGVGEAGAEAILPIEKLENWMNNGFNKMVANNYYANDKIDRLVELTEELLAKPSDIYMDKTKVGRAMAETNDNVGGQRVTFRKRGVLL